MRNRPVHIERKRTDQKAVIRIRAKTSEACKILPLASERNAIVPIGMRHRIVHRESKTATQEPVVRITAKTSEACNLLPL